MRGGGRRRKHDSAYAVELQFPVFMAIVRDGMQLCVSEHAHGSSPGSPSSACLGPEPAPVDQVALRDREGAFRQRVVAGVPDGAPREPDAPVLARSACFIQVRIGWADGSNSLAKDSGLRPARVTSITRRRNAGKNLFRGLGIGTPFPLKGGVSTKPGQLQQTPTEITCVSWCQREKTPDHSFGDKWSCALEN
jgi:hypothetical protein